eukprot:TRINITY_DN12075_c0_g1_i1.p1 TRINITY_DN12075_c0_g1~~TRINITY_DN12075_c0_g1_i1.p1  ORF type:complete len:119 (-),score=0.74 TRINITY_DN12075_c0_g1_i1:207-563(-)
MAVVSDEPLEVKFRLADGTDIGPSKFQQEVTVLALKESILAQWPSEGGPKSVNEITLINAGRLLENAKTLSESRVPMGEVPGTPVTMHVVVHPAHAEKATASQQPPDAASARCGCTIL